MRALLLALLAAACAAPPPITTTFSVGGMVCDSCEQGICAAVQKLEGVTGCAADFEAGSVEVRHDPRTAPDRIAAAIEKLGYKELGHESAP